MDKIMIRNCVIIGCGNVASHLRIALQKANIEVLQVFSQKPCGDFPVVTAEWNQLISGADLYLFSVNDNIYPTYITEFPFHNRLMVHTSGSLPSTIFEKKTNRYGVFYPFQSFSKEDKSLCFNEVPVFITGSSEEDTNRLLTLANRLSKQVKSISDNRRKQLHLAGVFINNFTNHMVKIGHQLAEDHGFEKADWMPLLQKTIEKLSHLTPVEAQTGPARRGDTTILNEHLKLLASQPDIQNIYKFVSENILNTYQNNDKKL
jgi:predicted short-subunit dehydrogenase-like oxidoreductase (DUF2520 family)